VYIRYQSPTPGIRGVRTGVFGLTNVLGRSGQLSTEEHRDWRAGNDWFTHAYPDPSDTDPSVYDEHLNPCATAWFKDSATHLLDRVPRYLEILHAHGVPCERVEAEDPGRVIYEDDVQIVVVPHAPSPGRPSSVRQGVRAGRGHEPLRHPVVDVMEPLVERAGLELDGCPQ
jgi:hypothetical protein